MARTVSYLFGAIMVVAGVWGFVNSPVLGVFDTNGAHALIYLVSGLVLLSSAAWWPNPNPAILKIIGALFAVLALWGFVIPGPVLGFIDNTIADNAMHVAFAVIYMGVGFLDKGRADPVTPAL